MPPAYLDIRAKCYIITNNRLWSGRKAEMTLHQHAHREAISVSPSILRLSAAQRLGGVAIAIALLWTAVYWAVSV